MVKSTSILLFVFFNVTLSAQIKGIVKDSLTQKPISFVNIWVDNENNGTTSQEDGTFLLATEATKKIVFSAIGYETKTTTISEKAVILLKPKTYALDEVSVPVLKLNQEIEIGDAEKMHHTQLSGEKPWIYARLFPYQSNYKETPYLKKIIFYSDNEKSEAKLKIRLFNFNDSIPTDDLLFQDIIVTVKRGLRKNTIDVSSYKIRFPEKGIVIGLEWMIIEENKFEYTYKELNSKQKNSFYSYAPSLVINYADEESAFTYSKGRWFRKKKITQISNKPWDNKVMVPAINLVLTN